MFNTANTKMFPWNENSNAAKDLAKEMGILRIKHEGSKFKGGAKYTVINYGSGKLPAAVRGSRIVNDPEIVANSSNKLKFFEMMGKDENSPRVPEWTTDIRQVAKWINEGLEVVGRQTLNGHSGEGIVFSSETDEEEFYRCKLFTLYKKKIAEFRVHIGFGNVIDVQKKMLRKQDDNGVDIDPKTIDFRIRNLANGFIFGREDIEVPRDVTEQALKAYRKSGLDFGAFDVLWNNHEGKAYVLEVNTAPGLQGQTLASYKKMFEDNL